MLTQHLEYPADMELALNVAKKARLSSAVLTGGRTPNPYGDDEVVDISIRGMAKAVSFDAAMLRNIHAGPDDMARAQPAQAIPPDSVTAQEYYDRLASVILDEQD